MTNTPSTSTATATPDARAPVLLAAGDISSCSGTGDTQTANLLSGLSGTVLTLGDNVYNDGTSSEYANCYDPTWGQQKARTKPDPGNHDYNTANAAGYFGYFGAAAGDPSKGYYSFDVAGWHIIALNSNCSNIGGCGVGSPEEQWLKADLAAHATSCTLAYWHHPRFSSGSTHGSSTTMQPFWQDLYNAGADIVLNGHEHNYERFAAQTPNGTADPTYGIVEFVVGVGGAGFYPFGAPIANSLVRMNDTFGVLQLTLGAGSYSWRFVPVAGKTFTDTGNGTCHAAPPVAARLASQGKSQPSGVFDVSAIALATLGVAGRQRRVRRGKVRRSRRPFGSA